MIPIPNVRGEILDKVIQFCKFHADVATNEEVESLKTDKVKEFNDSFINPHDKDTLFELILVSEGYMSHQSCRNVFARVSLIGSSRSSAGCVPHRVSIAVLILLCPIALVQQAAIPDCYVLMQNQKAKTDSIAT